MTPGPNYGQAMLTALINIQQLLMDIDQTTKQNLINSKSSNTTPGGLAPGSIGSHPGGFLGNLASGIGNGILNQIAPKLQNLRGQISQIMAQTYSTRVKNPNFNPNLPTGPGNQQYKTVQHDISMAKLGQILSLSFTKVGGVIVDAVKGVNAAIQDIGSGGRNRIADQTGKYGQFSPSMQNSIINYEFANMMRQMKSGEELAPSFDALVQSQMDLDDSTRGLKVAFEKFENSFWTGLNRELASFFNFFTGNKSSEDLKLERMNKLLEETGLDYEPKMSQKDRERGLRPLEEGGDSANLLKILESNQKVMQETLEKLNQERDRLLAEQKDTLELGKEIKEMTKRLQAIIDLMKELGSKKLPMDSATDVENKIGQIRAQHLEFKKKRREDIRREHERAQEAQR